MSAKVKVVLWQILRVTYLPLQANVRMWPLNFLQASSAKLHSATSATMTQIKFKFFFSLESAARVPNAICCSFREASLIVSDLPCRNRSPQEVHVGDPTQS